MIEITENAARQIHKMLAKRALGESGLRLGVKAGGCSGFEYVFGWEKTPRQDDEVFESVDGARVFIDPRSLRVLDGTVLDYDMSLLSKGFLLNNPHAKSTCGCGVSFSIERSG
jgi:iron-sulfur cluster assembly accessory protein